MEDVTLLLNIQKLLTQNALSCYSVNKASSKVKYIELSRIY